MWPFRKPKPRRKVLRASYDAAQSLESTAALWSGADSYDINTLNSEDIRQKLRNRARYEVCNNCYARGLVAGVANDCIGTGPRLQMQGENGELNTRWEQSFAAWALAINLDDKLRVLTTSAIVDGEAFAVLRTNPEIDHPVQLDIQPIECDRVTSPRYGPDADKYTNGIAYDGYGNPTFYNVLNTHPGAGGWGLGDSEQIPAEYVLHWFRTERPGQQRGTPEITPALPLFAQLRRYTEAVIRAAETAADFAAVIYTDAPAEETAGVEPLDTVALRPGMATTLPEGWKIGQIKAEQPTTNYGDFKREILCEIGRCLQVPVNIITGDSSRHNYASGRLDHQAYYRGLKVRQHRLGSEIMAPVLRLWAEEAGRLVPRNAFNDSTEWLLTPETPHTWHWDAPEHVDPVKEANAAKIRIESGFSSFAAECGRNGDDWEAVFAQRAREKQLLKKLGLADDEQSKLPNA